MKNSIDEQIEKLEKDLLGNDKHQDFDSSDKTDTPQPPSTTPTTSPDNNILMGLGILIPVAVGGGLYYFKPDFIMETQRKKKQLNLQRLVMLTAGATILSWLVLYGISK